MSHTVETKTVNIVKQGCHGCDGKGWISVGDKAQICPLCDGTGVFISPQDRYKPIWI